MNKRDFLKYISELGSVESVSGIVYTIISVNDQCIIGVRQTTQKEFRIDSDGLYNAYTDMKKGKLELTTTALRNYVNRTQSPALAILIALQKAI